MKTAALSLVSMFTALLTATSLVVAQPTAGTYGNCSPGGEFGGVSLKTVNPDTLVVATVLPDPGWFNGVNPESVQDGFEYCLAAEIAHRAGLTKLRLLNLAWDQYISGTARGWDIGMAATTITEPRREVFDFSRAYFSSNLGVAVRTGADVSAKNIRDKRIGVLQGNMGADWVVGTLRPSQQPSLYQSQPDMVTALIAGQVDAIISDTTLVLSATSAAGGVLEVVGQFEFDQGYGVLTPKGSANSPTVDEIIGQVAEEGKLGELSAAYLAPLFGKDPASVPVWSLD